MLLPTAAGDGGRRLDGAGRRDGAGAGVTRRRTPGSRLPRRCVAPVGPGASTRRRERPTSPTRSGSSSWPASSPPRRMTSKPSSSPGATARPSSSATSAPPSTPPPSGPTGGGWPSCRPRSTRPTTTTTRSGRPEPGWRSRRSWASSAAPSASGGRDRPSASSVEKARINVARSVRRAIAAVGTALPALGAHLEVSIVTGRSCRYAPEPATALRWTVERSAEG